MFTEIVKDEPEARLPLTRHPALLERFGGDQLTEDGRLYKVALQIVPPLNHADELIELDRPADFVTLSRTLLHESVVGRHRSEPPAIGPRNPGMFWRRSICRSQRSDRIRSIFSPTISLA